MLDQYTFVKVLSLKGTAATGAINLRLSVLIKLFLILFCYAGK